MKKLSFKGAAEKILKNADEPLSAKEITDIALDEGLIETSGATPEATMAAQLYTDTGKFKKVGKGLFALIKQTESAKSPLLAIQNQNDFVKQKLIEKLHSIDPFQLEYLVAELLTKIGYENVNVTRRSGDKGIDVTANLTVSGLTNVKTVIQVKRYKKGNNISGKYITQLRGSAEVDQRGLIITTSDFTKDAISESKAPNKMPVALVNGKKLIELLFRYKVAVKEEVVSVYSIDTEIFDEEFKDYDISKSNEKNRSLWPLPGGNNSFVETLDLLLEKAHSSLCSKKDLIKWFVETFENVKSLKTADGYLNVPKSMGLIEFRQGICYLTEAGINYLNSKDLELLFKITSSNIIAFDAIHEFLLNSNSPKTDSEILEYVNESFQMDWQSLAQITFRLQWLINLKKVEKTDEGFIAL